MELFTEAYNTVLAVHPKTRQQWREWLQQNHHELKSVWLIISRKATGHSELFYDEAVEEALCFGWVDSKSNKRNSESSYLYFARRNPKSNWSRLNKERVGRLLEAGLMEAEGLKMVELAKQSGTWDALNDVEELTIPSDLAEKLAANPTAKANFDAFPRSPKRAILEWILNAKRPETRLNRITDTVLQAEKNIKANQPRQ